MTLSEQMQSFVGWMQTHALNGFREYTEDNQSDDFHTVKDVLVSIAADMKSAVQYDDQDEYLRNKDLYEQYFITINEEIAKTDYADLLDDFLDSGLDNHNAQIMTVSELWENPLYRTYLDVTVEMRSPNNGEVLHLIGCHEHAKGRHPYVIAEEIKMLKEGFMDPWEYVRNREIQNVNFKSGTYS